MQESLGFLSVRRHASLGYLGGYLILNSKARPLEFHCTMPVKPSRAQELLYGKTIDDFVCGEQIGHALVRKAKLKPTWVLTDTSAALALSIVNKQLIAALDGKSEKIDNLQSPSSTASTASVTAAGLTFFLPEALQDQQNELATSLSSLDSSFDFHEPFQRIQEAILEAHPIAKAA